MAVLLILCEAHKDDVQSQLLREAMKEFGDALPVSHSSYLVYSELSADDVTRSLKKKIDVDHRESLMVITVPDLYAGPAPLKVKLWFEHVRRKVLGSYAAAVLPAVAESSQLAKPKHG